MLDTIFNFPISMGWQHYSNFLSKMGDWNLWLELILANFGFLLMIVIPGLGLSYFLQPERIQRSLRLSFGVALGFLVPIITFYVLGLAHLYTRPMWVTVGVILSSLAIVKYRKDFMEEWKKEPVKKSAWWVYGLITLYFLISYIALHRVGTLDMDILFGQIGPAQYLFNVNGYNPFDMGVIPILRHELFPGPISYHSAFMMFWVTPWVAVTAVMVFLAPYMLRLFGQVSEFIFKRSEYLTAILAMVTFAGFRLRGGRGTVLALIFLFAFLLLPRIYHGLQKSGGKNLMSLKKEVAAGSVLVALSLYTNVEIAAALLAVMGLLFVGAWLSDYRAWMKTILGSFAGGLLLYAPWFGTVVALVFADSVPALVGLYAALFLGALLLMKLPRVKLAEKTVEWIFLSLTVVLVIFNSVTGHFDTIFRLPNIMSWLVAGAALLLTIQAYREPKWFKHSMLLSAALFALIFVAVYPLLQPVLLQLGMPESVNYLLFEKNLGSVFPELFAKVQEYYLPLFAVMILAGLLAWLKDQWLWKKWTYSVALLLLLFFIVIRVNDTDLEEYPRGQSIGANMQLLLATQLAFDEYSLWWHPEIKEITDELSAIAEPDDKVFNLITTSNVYYPEFLQHYIVSGIGTVPLSTDELVSQEYTPELLEQVIAAGADYILIQLGGPDPEGWILDERTEVLLASSNTIYILLGVVK